MLSLKRIQRHICLLIILFVNSLFLTDGSSNSDCLMVRYKYRSIIYLSDGTFKVDGTLSWRSIIFQPFFRWF